jgi:6-phosphogluconolactonase
MLETFATSDEAADAATAGIVACLADAIAARGKASLVATGGRSPGPVYDRLCKADLAWDKVTVTLSDERLVPTDAPESNAGLLDRRLFCGPPGKAAFAPLYFPVETSDLSAHAAEPKVATMTPFDALMLGMGEDGHVASLLPRDPNLSALMNLDSPRLVMGVPAGVGNPPVPRITLTLRALLMSRAIFLMIAGDAKRQVIERALAGEALPVRPLLVQDVIPVRILWSPAHGA